MPSKLRLLRTLLEKEFLIEKAVLANDQDASKAIVNAFNSVLNAQRLASVQDAQTVMVRVHILIAPTITMSLVRPKVIRNSSIVIITSDKT